MTRKTVGTNYDEPSAYHRLIAPRYGPIARALVGAAELRPGERVLELGAGTGVVTKLVGKQITRRGSLCVTDLSPRMLEVARHDVHHENPSFVIVDYTAPFPFLDGSFDIVLSGLTYVQNSPAAVAEVARVLAPGGRLALAMWGNYYGKVRMMSAARRALGQSPYPSAAPGRALRRLERAGFQAIQRNDLEFAPRFASVDEYIAYRRGFGFPLALRAASTIGISEALRVEALRATAQDGSLTLGWDRHSHHCAHPASNGVSTNRS